MSATHRVWSVFDAPEAIRDWPVPSHARDIADPDQDQEAEEEEEEEGEEEGEEGEKNGEEEGEDAEDAVAPGGDDPAGAGGSGGDGDGDGDEDGSGDGLIGEASGVGDSGIIPLPPVDPSVEVDEAARKKVDKAGPGVFFPDPRWHGK